MTAEGWVAVVALAITVLAMVGAGVWRVAQLFGALPGMIATAVNTAIREHESYGCSNYEPTTSVQVQALRDHRDRATTAPGGVPRYRGEIEP